MQAPFCIRKLGFRANCDCTCGICCFVFSADIVFRSNRTSRVELKSKCDTGKKGGKRRTGAQLPLWSYGRKGLSQGRRWASRRELRGPQERQGPRPGQRLQRQPRSPRLQRGESSGSTHKTRHLNPSPWQCYSLYWQMRHELKSSEEGEGGEGRGKATA